MQQLSEKQTRGPVLCSWVRLTNATHKRYSSMDRVSPIFGQSFVQILVQNTRLARIAFVFVASELCRLLLEVVWTVSTQPAMVLAQCEGDGATEGAVAGNAKLG